MVARVLGLLPSRGGAYVLPIDSGWRLLQLEVRQLQPQLMVNVKLQRS